MGVMYHIVICHGIVTIFPRKRRGKKGEMHHVDLGQFFFFFLWLHGNGERGRAWNKGGMRMVYNEFLYSFLRDFLIYQRGRE